MGHMQLHMLLMLPSALQFLDVLCASQQKYSTALMGLKALTEHVYIDREKDRIAALVKNIVKLTFQMHKMLFILILVTSGLNVQPG